MMAPDTIWLDIYKWGTKDGDLLPWQHGIADSLLSYAAGNTNKIPSRKQAPRGAEIIEKEKTHITSLATILGDVRDTSS